MNFHEKISSQLGILLLELGKLSAYDPGGRVAALTKTIQLHFEESFIEPKDRSASWVDYVGKPHINFLPEGIDVINSKKALQKAMRNFTDIQGEAWATKEKNFSFAERRNTVDWMEAEQGIALKYLSNIQRIINTMSENFPNAGRIGAGEIKQIYMARFDWLEEMVAEVHPMKGRA